jgi:23S rRNA (cytidine2498-2'-O)-methyltransferase
MHAYFCKSQNLELLKKDLKSIRSIHENMILAEGDLQSSLWAQQIWKAPQILDIQSIKHGSEQLKEIAPWWKSYSFHLHRRQKLIEEGLLKWREKPLEFMQPLPPRPVGEWTLLEENKILYSLEKTHPVPLGICEFNENKEIPPSRAYLKLWEIFTVYGIHPTAGDLCLDMGACPGGWSWVLQSLKCKVKSVDKAPLDPKIQKLHGIEFIKKDAFQLKPADIGKVDWFFSDIICYPEKLLELIQVWLASGMVEKMVCTIKFQGDADYSILKKFQEIDGSRLIHLYHNKHEVMFIKN